LGSAASVLILLMNYAFMQLRIGNPFIRGSGVLFGELGRGPSKACCKSSSITPSPEFKKEK